MGGDQARLQGQLEDQNVHILNNTLSLNSLGNETFTIQGNVCYDFISFRLLSQFMDLTIIY